MSLRFLLPNYDTLSNIYLKSYLDSQKSFTNSLAITNASNWYIPSARSNVIYNYNPKTLRIKYKSEYVPIGYWDNVSYQWVWPWSKQYNKQFYETYINQRDMNTLRSYIGNLANNLVTSDTLKISPFQSSKIYQLIAAMSMSALGGKNVQILRYSNGNIVFTVIKKRHEMNKKIPPSVERKMRKSNKRKSSKH